MSATNPPNPNVTTFNNLNWISGDTSLSQDTADKRYLRFPTAQGTENLATINVSGAAAFNNEIVQTGATNAITQDITTNTDLNFLKATNIYGDLNLKKPTSSVGGSLTLYDIVAGVNTSQIYISGTTLDINNLTNSGAITFETKDGAGTSTTSLQITSALTTISNPVSFSSTTPPISNQTIPASNDSSSKIPTTAWVQSAIATVPTASPIISSVGVCPSVSDDILGTWNILNTPTDTQFVDIYSIGGGGNSGSDATSTGKAIGGSGGGGGLVLNSRLSMGASNDAIAILNQPQFVMGTTDYGSKPSHLSYTKIWEGNFTQYNNNITITTTRFGAMSVGTIIYYTKNVFDLAYASAVIPYGAYFNQLQIVSGSGSVWQVQTQQTQTLTTSLSATGYTPSIIWEGTFTQLGNTVTAVTTTAGTFASVSPRAYYLTCSGSSANTQYITSTVTSGSVLTVNSSQTIGTAKAGRILYSQIGNNVTSRYWTYPAGVNNGYTNFPYIAWCEGGMRGGSGYISGASTLIGGTGGYGGRVEAYLTAGSQISKGARGQKGGVNADFSGFTRVSGSGGNSYLVNNKIMTINGSTSFQPSQYGNGGSTYSPDASSVEHYLYGQGGAVLVSYRY